MVEYVFYRNVNGSLEACAACRSIVPLAEFGNAASTGVNRLCEVCAESDAGQIVDRPGADDGILRTIAVAANRILEAQSYFHRARTVDVKLTGRNPIRPVDLDPAPVEMTEAERDIYDEYTMHDRNNQVSLIFESQFVSVGLPMDSISEAQWVRAMLAKALNKMITDRIAALPARG